MKLAGILFLFICVGAATFSKCLIITAFNLNRQYIATNFCINKSNPVNHCNGHCYLTKQLSKEEKPASPFASNSYEKFEVQLFCETLHAMQIPFSAAVQSNFNQQLNFVKQEYSYINFRPPKA